MTDISRDEICTGCFAEFCTFDCAGSSIHLGNESGYGCFPRSRVACENKVQALGNGFFAVLLADPICLNNGHNLAKLLFDVA
jgi:hypothetical protein